MANSHKGDVEIELADGRKLMLCYDANAWVELEELSGLEMPEIIDKLQTRGEMVGGKPTSRVSMKLQRQLMFVGLIKHQPEITIAQAGELLFEAAGAMADALSAGMPDAEEAQSVDDAEDPTKSRPASDGRGSGSETAGSASA